MENILARDQRTTSHRVLDRAGTPRVRASPSTATLSSKQTKYQDVTKATEARTKPASAHRYLPCDSHFTSSTTFNDDRGLTVTTCLWLGFLLVNLILSVQGAPSPMTLEEKRLNTSPKWVNPCGLAAEDFEGDLDVIQLRDEQLLQQIVLQAQTALYHAERFRHKYLEYTFGTDFLNSPQFNIHYEWLPGQQEIPKALGEKLEQEYLDAVDLDAALLNAYEYMQKFAVGLEQIVWDQEDHGLLFRKEFKDTEFKLRTVLCELQVALVERGVTPRPDVTRDIMSSDYRKLSSQTMRDLRDWLIFRDYMNGLEYIVQVFEHLGQRLRSEQS